jgi:hypothetical protein
MDLQHKGLYDSDNLDNTIFGNGIYANNRQGKWRK